MAGGLLEHLLIYLVPVKLYNFAYAPFTTQHNNTSDTTSYRLPCQRNPVSQRGREATPKAEGREGTKWRMEIA